ncbi:MAG TPA: RdgB/HAM1 family non-canonical purine NTP pyrophosphatase [Verrucomicrobiae bacterium]|nr:RdgB/HAM1 family non-canonical purine NTP pyrophosphatase [Verrucomicrobiae bacterium]
MPAQPSGILIATTNPGKLREFQAGAKEFALQAESLPGLREIPAPIEDGDTFEDNARIKAEYYSRHAAGELVLAEDSGLVVPALHSAPGVYSARYAALLRDGKHSNTNSDDQENNRALIFQLENLQLESLQLERQPPGPIAGKYVCVIAAARNGATLQTFSGEAEGEMLTVPRGNRGFGYDPLFFFPDLGKTFAELTLEEKSACSHRGKAFRQFLEWYAAQDQA